LRLIALRKVEIRLFNTGNDGELGDFMSRSLKLVAVLCLTAMAVTACGKRGPLEAPTDDAASVQPKPKETPHRSNPLDGLLR
jgi:predicted small lipoprotein YifL